MVRQSVFDALVRMIAELDTLAPSFNFKAGDLEIRLFEGLRDMATQKELFETTMTEIMKSNPTMSPEEAYQETRYARASEERDHQTRKRSQNGSHRQADHSGSQEEPGQARRQPVQERQPRTEPGVQGSQSHLIGQEVIE